MLPPSLTQMGRRRSIGFEDELLEVCLDLVVRDEADGIPAGGARAVDVLLDVVDEAKLLGAKAVLLICSILGEKQISEYISICDQLGMSALVETHDEAEVETALKAGARIIGVNNRNLKDFSVNTNNSSKLRSLIPEDVSFVSESGVKTPEDIKALREIGANAVLIGETLMRSDNKTKTLAWLRNK